MESQTEERRGTKEKSPLLVTAAGEEETKPLSLSWTHKMLRLLMQFLTWVSIGTFLEVTGPVIPELVVQTQSNYETLLQSLGMRGSGHVVGGIIGGVLIDRYIQHIDLLSVLTMTLFVFFGVLAAYIQSIQVMFAVLLAQGTLETILNIAGYRAVFAAFKDKSAAACNVIQLGYSLGGIISPAVVAPFIDPKFSGIHFKLDGTIERTDSQLENSTETNRSRAEELDSLKMEYPAKFVQAYWILTISGLTVIMMGLCFYIHGRTTKGAKLTDHFEGEAAKSIKQQFSFKSCSPKKPVLAALILLMFFIHIGCMYPLGRVYSKIIFSYDRDGAGLSVAKSSLMTSTFWISSVSGILIFLIPASCVHVKYLIQIQATGLLVVSLLLYSLHMSETVLWTLFICLGISNGPLIASCFGMVNHYLELTSVAQMIPQIGAAVGDLVVMFAMGYSYQRYGPYSIWGHSLAIGVVVFTTTTAMQILGYLHGDRFEEKKLS